MKHIIRSLIPLALLFSCVPDNLKEKMNEGMNYGQKILADQEFKKAIAQIELHKLRNGYYPNSLSELQFLTAMDSTIFYYTQYTRLDSVYELNFKMEFPSFTDVRLKSVELKYPPEFWKGLGCVKSNVK
jgi:hypothetical protein